MPDFLEITVDKFKFKVAADRQYTREGVWAHLQANNRVRIGLSDYVQQQGGDVAFVSMKPAGTVVEVGGECAELETMKTALSLLSPVSGTIVEVNPGLELHPELVNDDPYGKGWLADIEASDWDSDCKRLLEPSAYLDAMQVQIREDLGQS